MLIIYFLFNSFKFAKPSNIPNDLTWFSFITLATNFLLIKIRLHTDATKNDNVM